MLLIIKKLLLIAPSMSLALSLLLHFYFCIWPFVLYSPLVCLLELSVVFTSSRLLLAFHVLLL